jgi:hypothetical protein
LNGQRTPIGPTDSDSSTRGEPGAEGRPERPAAPSVLARPRRRETSASAGVSPFEDPAMLARTTAILQRGYERYLAAQRQGERGEVDPDEAA